MWRDIRYAAQALVHTPLFTLAATLALGLAIGANATIFSLVDGLWLRPPGVRNPGEIVRLHATTQTDSRGIWSFPEYEALRDRTSSFAGMAALGRRGAMLVDDRGGTELLLVNVVSLDFFTTLGVSPAVGRLFAPGDEALLSANPGVVLGHAYWQRRFGSDLSIAGRTIALSRGGPVPVTVLGVLPAGFRDLIAAADRDLWLPPQTWTTLGGGDDFEPWAYRWFEIVARRANVPVSVADAEVKAVAAALASDRPETNAGRGARVVSDFDERMERGGVNALALLGLVVLVVGITCVNVTNLLLARAAGRSREIAVRLALGASRWRLLRGLFAESALLGAFGVLVGLTIAFWLVKLLPALQVPPPGFRSFLLFQADARVVIFTLAVTLLTTVLFGIAPGWTAARVDLVSSIKSEPGTVAPGSGRRWLPHALVVAQIAVSLVLLCAAAVLARSFVQTRRADLGITRGPVLSAWLNPGMGSVPSATVSEAVRQLAGLPGVARVATAVRAPLSLSGGGMTREVYFPDQPGEPGAGLPAIKFNAVSASYFPVMGTRLLRGEGFTEAHERVGEPVMIVNERFAAQFFPGRDPLGASVRIGSATGLEYRIIGIAQNAVINAIGEPVEPYLYLPFHPDRYGDLTFLLATHGDPAALAGAVRDTLTRVHPQLDPLRILTMAQYLEHSGQQYRTMAALAGALGLVGLVLTGLGLYGVVAYRTTKRTKEIGIRMALGATRRSVVRLVVADGLRVAIMGLAVGIPAALVATRLMASLLFGVGPWDVPAFTAAAAVLLLAVTVATLIPALRATRLSPTTALRES
jgi:predicted permease